MPHTEIFATVRVAWWVYPLMFIANSYFEFIGEEIPWTFDSFVVAYGLNLVSTGESQ